jgi:hypothetical protein
MRREGSRDRGIRRRSNNQGYEDNSGVEGAPVGLHVFWSELSQDKITVDQPEAIAFYRGSTEARQVLARGLLVGAWRRYAHTSIRARAFPGTSVC